MQKTNVAILGAGVFGQAIAHLLVRAKQCEITQWDKDPEKNVNGQNLQDVLKNAQVVFLCIPTFALPEALENIKKHAPDNSAVVIVSKGMLETDNEPFFGAEIAINVLGAERAASLGGPMLATEILESLPTNATLGCSAKVFEILKPLLTNTIFTIAHSEEPIAVSAAGVLKNVYAIGLGLGEGLGLGANFAGMFTEYAQEEMRAVLNKLKFDKRISRRAAGIGDLVATGTSAKSSNYSFGVELATKGKSEKYCEGNASLATLEKRLGGFDEFKLLEAIKEAISKKSEPRESLTKVFIST